MALVLYFRVGVFGLPSEHGPWPVLKGGGSGPVSLSPPRSTSRPLTVDVIVVVVVVRMSLFTVDRGPQIGKTVLVLCRSRSWVLSWS